MHIKGRIVGLYISPKSSIKSGEFSPMISVGEVEAVPGKGLRTDTMEDRYYSGEGVYSGKPASKPKKRDITFFAREALEGTDYNGIDTRRNVETEGIDPLHLSLLENIEFKAGEAQIRGYDACTPCAFPQESLAMGGVERSDFREAAPGRMGGLRAEIIGNEAKKIRVGDFIEGDIPDEIIKKYQAELA